MFQVNLTIFSSQINNFTFIICVQCVCIKVTFMYQDYTI